MKSRIVLALVTSAVLASGCSPFKKSTAAMLARHPPKTRTFPAVKGATVAPLAIGQWALYGAASGAGVASLVEIRLTKLEGFERVSVTDADAGRLRIRQWDQNKYRKVFTAAWVPGLARGLPIKVRFGTRTEQIEVPWPRQAWAGWGSCLGGFSGPSAIYGCLCSSGSTPASTDRPEGLSLLLRTVGREVIARFGNDPTVPRVDVTVPAGTFQQAMEVTFEPPLNIKILTLRGNITLWLHPAVPIDGVVKADIPAGSASTILQLQDFGGPSAKIH